MVRKWITTAVIVLVVLLGGYEVYSLARGASHDVKSPTADLSIAKDQAAMSDANSIKLGIESYMATNGGQPAAADQATLGDFVSPWPANPWTKAPMKPGSDPGDYTYTPGAGSSFTLTMHVSGGVTLPVP